MDNEKIVQFSFKFFLVCIGIALFLVISSYLHTFTGGKIPQGLVPTPKVEDILSHDR